MYSKFLGKIRASGVLHPGDDQGLLMAYWSSTLILLATTVGFLRHYDSTFRRVFIDMSPVFERLADKTFVTSDFFVNASATWNPRMIYGYGIDGAARLIHADWVAIMYFLGFITPVFVPVFFFLTLAGALRWHIVEKERRMIAIGVLAVLSTLISVNKIGFLISFAAWYPVTEPASPQMTAMLLGSTGIALRIWSGKLSIGNGFLSMMATVVHPIVGLLMYLYEFLLRLPFWRSRLIFTGALTVGIPMVLHSVLFLGQSVLSTSEFIRIYIMENHQFHYYIPFLLIPDRTLAVAMCYVLILFSAYIFYRKHMRTSAFFAVSVVVSHVLLFLVHHVGTVIVPVKFIAMLGLTRFHIVFCWLFVLVVAVLVGVLIPDRLVQLAKQRNKIFFWGYAKPVFLVGCMLSLIIGTVLTVYNRNAPERMRQFYGGFGTFVEKTNPNSVFVLPMNMRASEFSVSLRRPLVIHYDFPFDEAAFTEFQERKRAVYGSYHDYSYHNDKEYWSQFLTYHDRKSAADFLSLAEKYPLDYIVRPSGSPLVGVPPAYQDNEYLVYSTSSLQKFVMKNAQHDR